MHDEYVEEPLTVEEVNADTFVIADTHFFHENIVRFCGRDKQIALLDPDRHWSHNSYMVDRWNSAVGPDEAVLHLGDLYFWRNHGPKRFADDVAPRLNGRKYLLMGNHDKDKPAAYGRVGFKVIEPFVTTVAGVDVTFDHYPRSIHLTPQPNRVHVHGHIHNNGYPKGAGREGWKEGTVPTAPGQINVSVEMIDYMPRRLGELLKRGQ